MIRKEKGVVFLLALSLLASAAGCGKSTAKTYTVGEDSLTTEDAAENVTSGIPDSAGSGESISGDAAGAADDEQKTAAADKKSGSSGAVDAEIEMMNFGNTGSNIVEIPQFVTESGESTKAMEELNAETEPLQELYAKVKEEDDGVSFVEIRSYIMPTTRFLQVTTTYCEYPTYGTWGDLMTLAYDTKTDTGITVRDALEMSGYTGDQLSTDVHSAFVKAGLEGDISSTDMQGFELDDEGNVTAIYMKLGVQTEDSDSEYEAFYRFIPSTGKIFMMAFTDAEDSGADGTVDLYEEETGGSELGETASDE